MSTNDTPRFLLVDDSFPTTIDDKAVADFNLIERYVAGSLPEETAEAFEDYYLDKPDLITEIRLEKALRDGLREVSEELEPSSEQNAQNTTVGGFWKVAASVMAGLLLTAGVLSVNKFQSLDSTIAGLQQDLDLANAPKVVMATFALSQTRSGATTLPRPKPGELYALSVRAANGVEYAVHIENADQERVWSKSTHSMNTLGTGRLSVLIGHHTLAPGDYTLHLTPESMSNSEATIEPLAITIR